MSLLPANIYTEADNYLLYLENKKVSAEKHITFFKNIKHIYPSIRVYNHNYYALGKEYLHKTNFIKLVKESVYNDLLEIEFMPCIKSEDDEFTIYFYDKNLIQVRILNYDRFDKNNYDIKNYFLSEIVEFPHKEIDEKIIKDAYLNLLSFNKDLVINKNTKYPDMLKKYITIL